MILLAFKSTFYIIQAELAGKLYEFDMNWFHDMAYMIHITDFSICFSPTLAFGSTIVSAFKSAKLPGK